MDGESHVSLSSFLIELISLFRRIEHSLSIESSSEDSDSSFDSSVSTSTSSSAENRAIEAALLSGRTIRLQSMGTKTSTGSAKTAEKARKLEKKRMRKGKGKEQAWYAEKGGDSSDSSDDDVLDLSEDFGNGGEASWAEQDEDFIARMQVRLLLSRFGFYSSLISSCAALTANRSHERRSTPNSEGRKRSSSSESKGPQQVVQSYLEW